MRPEDPAAPPPFVLRGVSVPAHRRVGALQVPLNGFGLRRLWGVPIYVGTLYLAEPTRDAAQAITAELPKSVGMHYLVGVRRGSQARSFRTKAGRSGIPGVEAPIARLCGWLEDLRAGDSVVMDYLPGEGTTVWVRDEARGTLAGAPVMQALWSIYLGPAPATRALKAALLSPP